MHSCGTANFRVFASLCFQRIGDPAPVIVGRPARRFFLFYFYCQTLGASGAQDKDGEMIATLVNKGALDVIAKV